MLYPLTFQPIFKERVWGGRNLETLFKKLLPPGRMIGESWEISDRPEGVSVVANGSLAGKDLRWLMQHHSSEILGASHSVNGHFPLLVKILDAVETLSVQVHPPPSVATRLNGEPKTELWNVVQAIPGARLFAGLRKDVTRQDFAARVHDGTVSDCLNSLEVREGDWMFLPSGRVHAIGAGNVIFEIQQNSDTTYRVFDWNRLDGEGKARLLHISESMESIDFHDFEPGLVDAAFSDEPVRTKELVACPFFRVHEIEIASPTKFQIAVNHVSVIGVISGRLRIFQKNGELLLEPGQFSLLPGSLGSVACESVDSVRFLNATAA